MTVTSTKAPPAMATLQTLLAPDDSTGQDRASSLTNKIATAVSALTFIPTLHPLALEVVSSALLYQCSLVDPPTSQSPPENQLGVALKDVWTLLDSLLTHCPLGWSTRLFKWCVSVLGILAVRSPGPTALEEALRVWLTSPLLSPVLSLLNKSTAHLVSSGRGMECMEVLFSVCSQQSSNLNWLLTHVISLHPHQLTALLLSRTLSSAPTSDLPLDTLTEVFDHLSRAHRNALKRCVVAEVRALVARRGEGKEGAKEDRFAKLSVLLQVATHCQSLLSVVSEDVLKIATADTLTALIIEDGQSAPMGAAAAEPGEGEGVASDDNDEDEGEILSDEEGMEVGGVSQQKKGYKPGISVEEVVPLLAELICLLPGKEACQAVCVTLDVYTGTRQFVKVQEASIEEGEIVRESALHLVITGCKHVMGEVLIRLHSASCVPHLTPGGKGGGGGGGKSNGQDLELAIGLQEGVDAWCDRILEQLLSSDRDQECITWLQEILMCVCISGSELQAARALARLLCHAHSPAQISTVMSIYAAVQARHFYFARSTIQCALTSIQQHPPHGGRPDTRADAGGQGADAGPGSMLLNFTSNMVRVLRGWSKDPNTSYDQIRTHFRHSLHEQLLPLTQLLILALPTATITRELITTYDLMRLVLEPPQSPDGLEVEPGGEGVWLRPQSLNRMLRALLLHHFSLMKMLASSLLETGHTHLSLEAALGKSLWLISWCTLTSPGHTPSSDHSSSGSARIMAYTTIMDAILSQEMSTYFSTLNRDLVPISSASPSSCAELLAANLHVGRSRAGGHITIGRKGRGIGGEGGTVKSGKVPPHLASIASSLLTSHLTQLLLAIGSSPSSPAPSPIAVSRSQGELGAVLLDAVAPQCPGELKQWPDEETLKYSLERDLSIKHVFDMHPVLWQCLRIIADPPSSTSNEPSGLITCAPILRSLLTVLTQHWQRCCVDNTAMFSRELQHSVFLVECMAVAHWIPPPLAYIGELFNKLTPHEISLLLSALNTYMKQNFEAIKAGSVGELKDTGYRPLIKGVLVKNIQHFGHLYSRFMS